MNYSENNFNDTVSLGTGAGTGNGTGNGAGNGTGNGAGNGAGNSFWKQVGYGATAIFKTALLGNNTPNQEEEEDEIIEEEESRKKKGVGKKDGMPSFTTLNSEDLVELVHTLSAAGQTIQVPKLVVVGSQSSGKSSVLNSLMGFDMLPTSSVMTTRLLLNCQILPSSFFLKNKPLVPQQQPFKDEKEKEHQKENEQKEKEKETEKARVEFGEYSRGEWCITKTFVLTLPRPLPEEIGAVREFIDSETKRIAGPDNNISAEPLNVKIYSPNATPLSIVDTPGLVMVALKDRGQPQDIKQRISDLVMSQIKEERTVIVAVLPAREDIEADPAIEIVKRADPEGRRTIGILTKPDLMNTDVGPYLKNEISASLKNEYGYYVVRNRGPSEAHLSCAAGLELEAQYFSRHPVYAQCPQKTGIPSVARVLAHILKTRIAETIPYVLTEVRERLAQTRKSLDQIGFDLPSDPQGRYAYLTMLMTGFASTFGDALENRRTALAVSTRIKELLVGFRDECEAVEPFSVKACQDSYLLDLLKKVDGNKMKITPIPVDMLEFCLSDPQKRPIFQFKKPSFDCLQRVKRELDQLFVEVVKNSPISRFPNLIKYVREGVLQKMLEQCEKRVHEKIHDLLLAEETYLWTDDPKFYDIIRKTFSSFSFSSSSSSFSGSSSSSSSSLSNQGGENRQASSTLASSLFGFHNNNNEKNENNTKKSGLGSPVNPKVEQLLSVAKETDQIRSILNAYYSHVRETVKNCVPKYIMTFMVTEVSKNLALSLVQNLPLSSFSDKPGKNRNAAAAVEKMDIATLLAEDAEMATKRLQLSSDCRCLTLALETLLKY